MAAGSNPLAQMVMSALQAKTAGGGGMPGQGMPGMPPGGGGMPGMPGAGQSGPGQEFAKQASELKGADPGGLLRQLKAMKQIMAIMLVQNLERLPNVSGQISKLIPMFDRVIKEVQQAGNVQSAIPQIGMGAAQPPSPEGQPPAGGGMF